MDYFQLTLDNNLSIQSEVERTPMSNPSKQEKKKEEKPKDKESTEQQEIKKLEQQMKQAEEKLNAKSKEMEEVKQILARMKYVYEQKTGIAERRRQQQERKKAEQLRKKQEQEKRAEEKRQEEERKRLEEERKAREAEEKRQAEQRERLRKEKDFKDSKQSLQKQIKNNEEKLAVQGRIVHDQKFNIKQLLDFITQKRERFDSLKKDQDEIEKAIPIVKKKAEQANQIIDLSKVLQPLVQSLNKQRETYDEIEYNAILEDKKKLKEERQKMVAAYQARKEESKDFYRTNFYEQEIKSLYKDQIQKSEEQKVDAQNLEKEKEDIETKFQVLRIKQKQINELKILIEMYQISKEELDYHKFDLSKFKQLMTRKAVLVEQISKDKKPLSDMEEFNKIEEELAKLLLPLHTEQILVPYRYPQHLLTKTKQDLVKQFYINKAKELEKVYEVEKKKVEEVEIKKAAIAAKLEEGKELLKKAEEEHSEFIKNQKEQIQQSLNMDLKKNGDILPKDMFEIVRSEPVVEITNKKELRQLYDQMSNQEQTQQIYREFQAKRKEKFQLEAQLRELNERYLSSSLNIQDYLAPTPIPELNSEDTQRQQRQLNQLLKQCEQIEHKKRIQAKKEERGSSNINLYSSIFL